MKLSRFLKPAEDEMVEAALFYNSCAHSLGGEFLDKVQAAIHAIEENPETWPIIGHGMRRRLVHRFPYAIFYVDDPEEIVIAAVAHLKRRPFYWLNRK